MDIDDKAYGWNVSKEGLLETASNGPGRARLLWKARYGWNGGVKLGVGSGEERTQATVVGQDVYICNPARNESFFEKVWQLDAEVGDWDIDAKGILWACRQDGKIARLKIFPEHSIGSRNREDEITC